MNERAPRHPLVEIGASFLTIGGREYTMFFVADQLGTYQLNCGTHTPSMTATILVLPR